MNMNSIYDLCKSNFSNQIPKIGKFLGSGQDGEVFELNDKVIKFCLLKNNYRAEYSLSEAYEIISNVLSYLIATPTLCFAKVFSHFTLGSLPLDQDNVLYFYTMEKLNKISEDESKVFHTLLSHEDSNKEKKFTQAKLKILRGLSRGLDFDENSVKFFCENYRSDRLFHNDVHPRNIMKDHNGNFVLIDFDRVLLKG